jgi:hypothetical protein
METILFALLVAVVATLGIALGLAVAPRLSRWDERRNRPQDEQDGGADAEGPAEREGDIDRE